MKFREWAYETKWRLTHPQAFGAYARLAAGERLSTDELAARQELARQEIVRLAFSRVAFYRDFYSRAGFTLADIGGDGWFERLPVLTKTHLREHFDELFNPELRRFAKFSTTGGSTGTPTRTAYDRRLPEEAYSWRLQGWFGVHPSDHRAYVWRETRPTAFARFKNAALWWPTVHLKLDATHMTEEMMATFFRRYARLRPSLVFGYVGAVSQLARYAIDRDLVERVRNPNLKVVWATSAPIPPVQRRMIEDAFGARVCDQYGSCEVRLIAQQCPECKGLHVNVEHVHVEFVDGANRPVPAGEYGRTLLTNLEDTVFPVIRYENGDRGRWLTEPCSCGRTLPCIDSVKGRESESFVLPDGGTINGEYLTTIFDAAPELVRGFRVVQHPDLSITVEYVPAGDDAPVLAVLREFEGRLHAGVPVDFRHVDEIPQDRGKLRFVVREKLKVG